MTEPEFIARAIGLPWARWRSDWTAADCWGLCLLHAREVRGVDLGQVPQVELADGLARELATGRWLETGPEPGASVFMAWRDGAPTHCGLLVTGGQVLHSPGSDEHPGSARTNRLPVMARLYGRLSFYRYAPC